MKQGYLRNGLICLLTACMLAALISCGVGDGGGAAADGGTSDGTTDGTTPTTPPTATAAFIGLGTDTAAVKSDDSNAATITATVLDDKSAVIEGIFVTFSASCDTPGASCGTLSASSVKTNADGKASITFRSGTIDQSNRVITINATASGKSAQPPIPIQVVGSTLTMTSSTTVDIPSDGSVTSVLKITAKNAGGIPVYNVPVTFSVTGTGNVTLSPPPTGNTTDQSGNISVTVTGARAGTATVKAEGLGAEATYDYTVSGLIVGTFGITSPTVDPASSSTASTLTVEVTVPDAAVTPNVTFATTLGTWDGPTDAIVTKAVDPATKKASAVLQSSRAGRATVQVYDSAAPSTTDSVYVDFYAPATDAAQISLQPDVSVLALSTGGTSKTTTLRATVRTSLAMGSQPVGYAPVAFSIANPTGGGEFISPVVTYTNAAGLATATFTSGTASSGAAGVAINAQVAGSGPPALTAQSAIVIGGTAGSVVIGRGSKITVMNPTTYALPMSVLVADSDGNPVPGAIVSLGLWPAQYSSGVWFLDAPPADGEPYAPYITGTFNNEDVNQNLIRDPGEDLNGDGSLTPPNSAGGTVPATVTTEANGVANFDLVYMKGSAVWIRDRIRATTLALGTETSSSITFTLPAEKTDYEAGDLPDSPYPIGLTVAATPGSMVSYILPAFVPQYGTATYTVSSSYSTINSTSRIYTFIMPVTPPGDPAGTVYVYDDLITASRAGTNPRSATVWVRIVAVKP